jgi:hypothetical protein
MPRVSFTTIGDILLTWPVEVGESFPWYTEVGYVTSI